MIDKSKLYIRYAVDAVNGNIIVCKAIKQACERFLSWFDLDDRYFDFEDVDKKIKFVSKLKHSTGKHAGQPFILLPWQQFCFAGIFGWKYKSTGYRITRKAFLFISRKNGKSALAAALGLVSLLADNEAGAEVDIVANTTKQASILFEMSKNFSESVDPKKKIFKRFRTDIKVPYTKSIMQIHSSDSMSLDGWNASTAIIDEFHAAKDWGLYNVLQSSQGMREQPLMLVITTAGFLCGEDYPCYSMYMTCKRMLNKTIEDERQFALIYELDEDDDWTDDSNWIKCCPSLGQTVFKDYMEEQMTSALNNPALEVGVKTKTFNYFMQSSEIWISNDEVKSVSQKVNFEDLKGEDIYLYGGLDLAEVEDMASFTALIVKDDIYYFKTFAFIPRRALEVSSNRELYKQWIRSGYLNLIDSEVIDNDKILEQIIECDKVIPVGAIGYDPWRCKQLALKLDKVYGYPVKPISQGIAKFSEATRKFTSLVITKQCIIDDNPVVRWTLGNAKLEYDRNGNCKPIKDQKTSKIDCVITMIQALKLYMDLYDYEDNELEAVALD